MPGLLYYLPRKGPEVVADFAGVGLDYALTPGRIACCEVRGGPDGGDGVVVADSQGLPSHLVGCHADRQEWMEWKGPPTAGGREGIAFWVGRYRGEPVAPQDLARAEQLRGHVVRLADGQSYLIPVARGWSEEQAELRWYCALPQRTTIDSAGHWVNGDVLPRLAALWEVAQRWHDSKQAAAGEGADDGKSLLLNFDDFNDAALLALGANYRVARPEVVLLGLFTTETACAILDAVVDRPTLLEWLKKKTAATPAGWSSSAGPAAAIAATAPASPT